MSAYPVLGFDLAVYILPAVVVFLIVLGIVGVWLFNRDGGPSGNDDRFGSSVLATLGFSGATLVAVITAFFAIPWQTQYWTWYRVDAHVESVSNTLRDASGDLTSQPVVVVKGLDRPVTVDDPRIVTMSGQDVSLVCKPTWHFRAADTYNCRIYEYVGSAE